MDSVESAVNFPCQRKFQLICKRFFDFLDLERSIAFWSDLLVVHDLEVVSIQPYFLSFCESFKRSINLFCHSLLSNFIGQLSVFLPLQDSFHPFFQVRDLGRREVLRQSRRLISHDQFERRLFSVCMGSAITLSRGRARASYF